MVLDSYYLGKAIAELLGLPYVGYQLAMASCMEIKICVTKVMSIVPLLFLT